jgi:dipeptidyl aminopeptidase/acylaminoacyl peptidase
VATGTRFDTLRRELGDDFVAVEFEGRGHSVVTMHRQQEAVDRVLSFLGERLRA